MIDLLVVDDDEIIRKGLIKIISNLGMNIDRFYEEEDGEDALEFLGQTTPAIVITDIKMHHMNGLDFIARGRKLTTHTQYIILSGYSDFEFAKAAIQRNVVEYLLKPVRKDELKESLEKAIAKFNQSQNSVSMGDNLRKHFFKDCATNFNSHTDYSQALKDLEISLPFEGFAVVCSTLKKNHASDCQLKIGEYPLCAQYEDYCQNVYGIFNLSEAEYNVFALMCQSSLNTSNDFATFGVSSFSASLGELHKLAAESQTASLNRFLVGSGRASIYTASMLQKREGLSLSSHHLQIAHDMEIADVTALSQHLQEFFRAVMGYRYVTIAIFTSALEDLCKNHIQPISLNSALVKSLCLAAADLFELRTAIMSHVEKSMKEKNIALKWINEGVTNPKMHTAIKYIKSNFKDIQTIAEVAEHICVTPNYLSKLFKTEINTTFSEFLLLTRLEAAKKLLIDPQYKVYEISYLVGIEDEKYFFKLFKKYVGVTPNQYRVTGPTEL